MKNLNEITRKYLKLNGVSATFFARWIGCDRSKCQKWLTGDRKLSADQETKVLEFLSGKWITPFDQIVSVKD